MKLHAISMNAACEGAPDDGRWIRTAVVRSDPHPRASL
jgi:hypothetical protein